jgi:probable F420-dependent oxidoreductase
VRRSRETLKRFAVTLEELGYDSMWLSEHLLVPMNVESPYPYSADGKVYWDHRAPWLHSSVALGFVSGITERIRLGTTIIPMMTRNPLALAKEGATLDVVSGGRFELGLGAGWCLEEAEMLGIASDHPIGRVEETVEILRLAWGEDTFEYHGRFFDFDEVSVYPKPVQGAQLPIFLGGQSPRMVRLSAEKADGNIISGRVQRLPEIRAAMGPDKLVSAQLTLTPDFDPEDALRRGLELRDLGASHLSLTCKDADTDGIIALLTRFSKEVMGELRAAEAVAAG